MNIVSNLVLHTRFKKIILNYEGNLKTNTLTSVPVYLAVQVSLMSQLIQAVEVGLAVPLSLALDQIVQENSTDP